MIQTIWQFSHLTQGCFRYLQISSTAHCGVSIRSILFILGTLPHRLDHPYVKCNCEILFLGQMSSLLFLCFKICFLINNHCKRLNVFSDPLEMTRIFWTLHRVYTHHWHKTMNIMCRGSAWWTQTRSTAFYVQQGMRNLFMNVKHTNYMDIKDT